MPTDKGDFEGKTKFDVREKDCEQEDGTSGSWVVWNEETESIQSCHKSKKKASISAGLASGQIEDEED